MWKNLALAFGLINIVLALAVIVLAANNLRWLHLGFRPASSLPAASAHASRGPLPSPINTVPCAVSARITVNEDRRLQMALG